MFIDGVMNTYKYINILKENVHDSADCLGIRNNFKFYQDNNPEHKAYATRQSLLYNCSKVMETLSQNLDINLIENYRQN